MAIFFLTGASILICSRIVAAETDANVPIRIEADFPGGNIVVDRVEGDTLHLRPDMRDSEGWWFYWNFRVAGVGEGRTLTFDFGERSPVGVRGPAVSTNGGAAWTWLGSDYAGSRGFSYTFKNNLGAWFSFAVPYLEADLRSFLKKWGRTPSLSEGELCKSADGRKVEVLRAGCIGVTPRCRVLITARHHACETMASYVLEGILNAVLADDDDGHWFQQYVEVMAIPFMDKDGVQEGDQGKNRRPRDHNRDYDRQSIYPETAALRTRMDAWGEGLLRVALDLHCPYIRGQGNEVIYLVGSPNEEIGENQEKFAAVLERVKDAPLPYHASDNLAFGQGWNTADNYDKGLSFARWAENLAGMKLATTMEIPYANAGGQAVTPESARALGSVIARAIKQFVMDIEGIPE